MAEVKGQAGTTVTDEELRSIESFAAKNLGNEPLSMFGNEALATKIWLTYVSLYWTITCWVGIAVGGELLSYGVFVWAVAAIGICGCWYLFKEGKYPSGSTKDDPTDINSTGRYGAIYVIFMISTDLILNIFFGIKQGFAIPDILMCIFHMIGLIFGTLFFYNRFRLANPDVATTAFLSEWFDIGLSLVVIFVLHSEAQTNTDNEDGCFDQAICVTYFTFVILQTLGWVLPMIIIKGWGSSEKAAKVCLHLFLLDCFTDGPILIAILAEEAYIAHPIIFIDALWKSVLLIRSLAYYLVYQIWLDKGFRFGAAVVEVDETANKQP